MQKSVFDFRRDVLEKSDDMPVLVDFWAEWCGPCRTLGPVLEKVAAKHKGEFVLVKINTEEYPDVAREYGVMSIPVVKLFIEGNVVDEFVGALPETQIEQWLKKSLPCKYADRLREAEALVLKGDEAGAQGIFEEILSSEPESAHAAAGLVRLLLFSEPDVALGLVDKVEGDREYAELGESARTLAPLLLRNSGDLPENAVRERYSGAIEHLRRKKFDVALSDLIEVIRENRYYDDDGARKACIAVFRYLGEDDPVTLKHRRVFDRALY